jgi:hypothetical protein
MEVSMPQYIHEVVKTYLLMHDEISHIIKARVTRLQDSNGNEVFTWDISHYYKLSKRAKAAYIPAERLFEDLHGAQDALLHYMDTFKNIGVIPNEYY